MPEIYNNVVCVSEPELVNGDSPIISSTALKLYKYRNPHVKVRRPSANSPVLLNWDLLRADLKAKYIEKYKQDPKDVAKPLTFFSQIKTDYKAVEFFATYKLPDGRCLKTEKQKEYSNNASVLNALLRISNDRKAIRKALGGKTTGIWKELAERVAEIKPRENSTEENTAIAHTLPLNPIRLKNKVKQYSELGYISIIPDKYCNNNASKVSDNEQQAALRTLFRKHNNFDNAQIQTLYNIIAENLGWDKITAVTVANYRAKWNMVTFSGRRGENAFDNELAMQVKRKAPSYPLYYWTMDGWDVELLYQKTEVDRAGNSKTTYHNRLTVVVILDPCIKYPIGYAIGTHETPELIKKALANAILHTKELFGDYHKVLQIQSDNYAKKALTPLYDAVSEKYTPARVKNSKAKVIEPRFNYLNKKYCQYLKNWSGIGITGDKNKQPNDQYLNKIRHSFPDEIGCKNQIKYIIESERALIREKYLALYAEMPAEDKLCMPIDELLYYFGNTTGYVNSLTGPGVIATIDGREYQYDSFDRNFRENAHESWSLHYIPEIPEKVLAVNANGLNGKLIEEIGTKRYILEQKYIQPMALRERKEGDGAELAKINQFNKAVKADITEGMAEDYRTVEQLFINNPKLDGTLSKMVLIDSNGQHKDNKSAARLNGAKKQLEKQNRKAEIEEKKNWSQEQEEYLKEKVDLSNYLNQ